MILSSVRYKFGLHVEIFRQCDPTSGFIFNSSASSLRLGDRSSKSRFNDLWEPFSVGLCFETRSSQGGALIDSGAAALGEDPASEVAQALADRWLKLGLRAYRWSRPHNRLSGLGNKPPLGNRRRLVEQGVEGIMTFDVVGCSIRRDCLCCRRHRSRWALLELRSSRKTIV